MSYHNARWRSITWSLPGDRRLDPAECLPCWAWTLTWLGPSSRRPLRWSLWPKAKLGSDRADRRSLPYDRPYGWGPSSSRNYSSSHSPNGIKHGLTLSRVKVVFILGFFEYPMTAVQVTVWYTCPVFSAIWADIVFFIIFGLLGFGFVGFRVDHRINTHVQFVGQVYPI